MRRIYHGSEPYSKRVRVIAVRCGRGGFLEMLNYGVSAIIKYNITKLGILNGVN